MAHRARLLTKVRDAGMCVCEIMRVHVYRNPLDCEGVTIVIK